MSWAHVDAGSSPVTPTILHANVPRQAIVAPNHDGWVRFLQRVPFAGVVE